ncbi:hypothetical protein PR048_022585 [Dryococelus australis]|uniref:Uncharacterized protein n=1 Tax=Dryococelus australis TaxID=614101 RepID=A0ABQ9H1F9_9NEOP|nr:hypothetical protein PR048_022585 [Dryococelus australis]
MERRRNEGTWGKGESRENPPISGIPLHHRGPTETARNAAQSMMPLHYCDSTMTRGDTVDRNGITCVLSPTPRLQDPRWEKRSLYVTHSPHLVTTEKCGKSSEQSDPAFCLHSTDSLRIMKHAMRPSIPIGICSFKVRGCKKNPLPGDFSSSATRTEGHIACFMLRRLSLCSDDLSHFSGFTTGANLELHSGRVADLLSEGRGFAPRWLRRGSYSARLLHWEFVNKPVSLGQRQKYHSNVKLRRRLGMLWGGGGYAWEGWQRHWSARRLAAVERGDSVAITMMLQSYRHSYRMIDEELPPFIQDD